MKGWGLSAVPIGLLSESVRSGRDLLVGNKQEFLFQHLPKELIRFNPYQFTALSAGVPWCLSGRAANPLTPVGSPVLRCDAVPLVVV